MSARVVDPHAIETASGGYLDLADPAPFDVVLDDVAHALAATCRFGGHCRRFYSVAEHAVLVALRLEALGAPTAVVRAGLHHDDAEAFVGDVPRPLKSLIPGFAAIERDVAIVCRVALHVDYDNAHDERIKAADDWALANEAADLLPSGGRGWFCEGLVAPEDRDAHDLLGTGLGQPPAAAARLYLDTDRRLRGLAQRHPTQDPA